MFLVMCKLDGRNWNINRNNYKGRILFPSWQVSMQLWNKKCGFQLPLKLSDSKFILNSLNFKWDLFDTKCLNSVFGISSKLFGTLTHFSPMLHFYTPWKHKKTWRFSNIFRGYRNVTLGKNELMGNNDGISKYTRNLDDITYMLLYFLANIQFAVWY